MLLRGMMREVALQFDVSESWVRRIKQERRALGKTAPKTTRDRRKSWEAYAEWILKKLDQRPDIYLRELQAAAKEELGWEVSDVTLCVEGAITGQIFTARVEQHLAKDVLPGDIVVMDNLSSHKTRGVSFAITCELENGTAAQAGLRVFLRTLYRNLRYVALL